MDGAQIQSRRQNHFDLNERLAHPADRRVQRQADADLHRARQHEGHPARGLLLAGFAVRHFRIDGREGSHLERGKRNQGSEILKYLR